MIYKCIPGRRDNAFFVSEGTVTGFKEISDDFFEETSGTTSIIFNGIELPGLCQACNFFLIPGLSATCFK
jgi:hypothetical protein